MGTCACHHLPSKGKFYTGKEYLWQYIIDGIIVEDETGTNIDFGEIDFLICFTKQAERTITREPRSCEPGYAVLGVDFGGTYEIYDI